MKVAIGRLFHESHWYNPVPTSLHTLEIVRGDDLLEQGRSTGSTLGGGISVFESNSLTVLCGISDLSHAPSGPIVHDVFIAECEYWKSRLERMKPDAVFLDLHGAMATTENGDDPEGEFLELIRNTTGETCVIGCGLDMHAHITPKMLTNADIVIACKENPHVDFNETGQHVAKLMLLAMAGAVKPVYAMAKARCFYTGGLMTTSGPLRDMNARARATEKRYENILDISLCNTFRFKDALDVGEVALVMSNGPSRSALSIANNFAQEFWDRKEEFVDNYLDIDSFLSQLQSEKGQGLKPVVAADMGDRTLAGAWGDSTAVLQAVHGSGGVGLRGAMTLYDQESVEIAFKYAEGDNVQLSLGGKVSETTAPYHVECRLLRLNTSDIKARGPVFAGASLQFGRTALVEIDNRIQVVLTSKPGLSHDPAAFLFHGINLDSLDFVLVKSGSQFIANFKELARPLLIATPGIAHYSPGNYERQFARIWPEHDVARDNIIPARTYARNRYQQV